MEMRLVWLWMREGIQHTELHGTCWSSSSFSFFFFLLLKQNGHKWECSSRWPVCVHHPLRSARSCRSSGAEWDGDRCGGGTSRGAKVCSAGNTWHWHIVASFSTMFTKKKQKKTLCTYDSPTTWGGQFEEHRLHLHPLSTSHFGFLVKSEMIMSKDWHDHVKGFTAPWHLHMAVSLVRTWAGPSAYLDLSHEGLILLLHDGEVHRQRGIKQWVVVVDVRHHDAHRGSGGLQTHTRAYFTFKSLLLSLFLFLITHSYCILLGSVSSFLLLFILSVTLFQDFFFCCDDFRDFFNFIFQGTLFVLLLKLFLRLRTFSGTRLGAHSFCGMHKDKIGFNMLIFNIKTVHHLPVFFTNLLIKKQVKNNSLEFLIMQKSSI